MNRPGNVALVAALICFAIYFTNVLAGAFRSGALFRDVAEMLLLLASCVFFVIGILAREAADQSSAPKSETTTGRST